MRMGYYTSNSDLTWSSASGYIAEMAKEDRPWQFGLYLLHNGTGGVKHDARSPRLAALIERVSELYHCRASSDLSWQEAAEAIRTCDFSEKVTDPFDANVHWTEHSALAALLNLTQAGGAAIAGQANEWHMGVANACHRAAAYQADIVSARFPHAPTPSSPLYDDRIKEIEAQKASLAACQKAANKASQAAYQGMLDHFGKIVRELRRQKQEAAAQEEASIAALPFCQRWKLHLGRSRQAA